MQPKSRLFLILFALISVMILMPACAKMLVFSAPKDQAPQEEEGTDTAQLEEERLKKEAEERELRAAKIKFMYEDVHFKKGSYD